MKRDIRNKFLIRHQIEKYRRGVLAKDTLGRPDAASYGTKAIKTKGLGQQLRPIQEPNMGRHKVAPA